MSVQVKICGVTNDWQARACLRAGADAIGLMFYPQSKRFVTDEMAQEICRQIAGWITRVGVFVDSSADEIIRVVKMCGLETVQLHGSETPQLAAEVRSHGVRVVKVLKKTGWALMEEANSFNGCVDSLLVEAVQGELPGGNGEAWDWSGARILSGGMPFALAGGLTAENVAEAIQASGCDAVDVSSGVEASPGVKDMNKVMSFIYKAKSLDVSCRRVF